MEKTLEEVRITRLRDKTGCSYDKAEEALSQGDGSLIVALLYLEEKSQVRIPVGGGFYSTKEEENSFSHFPEFPQGEDTPVTFFSGAKLLFIELWENSLQIWYKERYLVKVPVLLLLLSFPFSYGSIFPLLAIPMFFGIHYRFSLQESFLAEFNPILLRMSASLFDISHKFNKKK